jgi:Ca2+-binding EF-hand superfamily protein
MKEADIDGDGQITFNEFKEVMLEFKKKTGKIKYSWSL